MSMLRCSRACNSKVVALAAALLVAAVASSSLFSVPGVQAADKCGSKCQERHERIKDMRDKTDSGMFRMNFNEYKDLVMTKPRNYQTVFVLNALNPRRGCAVCRTAYEEFKIVVKSFYDEHPDQQDKWFFATIDMDGNEPVFKKLKTQSILVYFHVPESGSPVQNSQQLTTAGEIAKYITSVTGLKFTVNRPPNYFAMITTVLALAVAGVIAYFTWDFLSVFLRGNELWTYLGLAFTFLMLSGHMWLQIRGAPFWPQGGSIFANTTQSMYGIESYALIILYAGVTAGIIFLNNHALKKTGDKQSVMTFVGVATIFFFFSYLVHCFSFKSHGYPYKFY